MGNPRKAWEIQGKHGKSREGMGNPGRVGYPRVAWENPGKHGKSREILGKHRKSQEKMGNEVLHLTFPCMEFFFHTWKKDFHGPKKVLQGTDLSPNWNVPEVFTALHKGVVDGRK